MKVYFSPAYVMAATEFDTTRKAGWVADSLRERPIEGVALVEPMALTAEAISAIHDPAYVEAVRPGEPAENAGS